MKALFEGRIEESEAGSAQADVREHRVAGPVVGHRAAPRDQGGDRRHPPYPQRTFRESRKCGSELAHPHGLAVHDEVAPADRATLRQMHQGAGTVAHVNGRYPPAGIVVLQHMASGDDRLHHVLAEPRCIAIDPSGQCGHDRQTGHHISVEAIERRGEAVLRPMGKRQLVFGDRPRGGRPNAVCVGNVNDSSRGPGSDGVQQMRVHRYPRAGHGGGAALSRRPGVRLVGRQVKHPVRRGFVLPASGHEEITEHRDGADSTQPLGLVRRAGEGEHPVATASEFLDQFGSDESCGPSHERRGRCVP